MFTPTIKMAHDPLMIASRIALFATLLVLEGNAFAQEATNTPAEIPAAPVTAIATQTTSTENADITWRIQSIFSEIETLKTVRVQVSAGVVTLSGTVPTAADVKRAEEIASRVSGVVTVQNDVTRDLDVSTNLTPAVGQFGQDLRGVVQALPLIGVAFAIGLAIAFLGHLLASFGSLWRRLMPNIFLAELAATFIRIMFIILGLVAALQVLGATALLGGVLGGAGVIGIAIGFAVRDNVANYVSSIMLSLRQPFRANEHVVIEEHEGRVVRLTSRATVLMTLDGNHLRIPNAIVFKAVILNYTRNPLRRFTFDLGMDADDDPNEAMAVGLAAVNGLDFVLDTPKATAIIQDVGDSNILLRFFGWLDQAETDFLKGRSCAISAAAQALTEAGFALPEPIYRLRFDESAPLSLKSVDTAKEAKRGPSKPASLPLDSDESTTPDTHVEELVAEERAELGKEDLLDRNRPIE